MSSRSSVCPIQFGSGVTSRVFTTGDPEGNLWTFGTYVGPVDR